MPKANKTISLDSDLIDEVKALNINLSGEINEYLKGLIANHKENLEGINIKIERINMEKALKKMNHWQNLMKASQTKIQRWEELKKEKEQKALEQEKEALEKKKKCANCGAVWGEDYQFHIFSGKNICKPCFLNANSEKIAEWGSK